MAIKTFNLPDPGEGLVEAEIVEWKVSPGDTVKVNDMVLEIETAKSLVELPIPWAGTVKELLVEVGQTIDVGTPIISIDDGKGGDDAPAAAPSIPGEKAAPAEGAGGGSEAILVGYGAKAGATARRARKGMAAAPVAAATDRDRAGRGCRTRRRARSPGSACRVAGSCRPGRVRCRWPSQGEAARPQARQGPRHRPRVRHPDRGRRHHHARRRDEPCTWRRRERRCSTSRLRRRRCRAGHLAYAVRRG